MYECEVCGRKYRSEHWLRRHMESKHSAPSAEKQEESLLTACRGLGIDASKVMSFKVYEDKVVIVEGPVGRKRVWRRQAAQ